MAGVRGFLRLGGVCEWVWLASGRRVRVGGAHSHEASVQGLVRLAGGQVQRVSLQGGQSSFEGGAGLIAQLPPMFRTKLDCPRDGGCAINTVKSLPGGSSCKGRDAIGSKHKFSCFCGLKWQENNWRERERLTTLGEADTRCIQFLPTQSIPKRKQSVGGIAKK